jgi:hypothetical protein
VKLDTTPNPPPRGASTPVVSYFGSLLRKIFLHAVTGTTLVNT